MRVTSWNCFRGADVLHGLSLLSPLRSDLITLQECRRPASDSASVIWRGTDPRQGVAVVNTEWRRGGAAPQFPLHIEWTWRTGGKPEGDYRSSDLEPSAFETRASPDQHVSQTAVCDTRAKTPSSTRRRVSYLVSDSMSCIRPVKEHGTEDLFHDVQTHRITHRDGCMADAVRALRAL